MSVKRLSLSHEVALIFRPEATAVPVVVYTGAAAEVLSKNDLGHTDGVVYKTHDVRADLAQVMELLQPLLAEEACRARGERPLDPRLDVHSGRTSVEAVIRLFPRVKLRNIARIVERCRSFPADVRFEVLASPLDEWELAATRTGDLKSVMEVAAALLLPHARIAIHIAGDDPAARTLGHGMTREDTEKRSLVDVGWTLGGRRVGQARLGERRPTDENASAKQRREEWCRGGVVRSVGRRGSSRLAPPYQKSLGGLRPSASICVRPWRAGVAVAACPAQRGR